MRVDWNKYTDAFYMTRMTLGEYPFGNIQATYYGPRRIGKTICIILKQMDIYRILYPDLSVDERFDKAMDNTIYTISEMIKKTEEAQRRYDAFEGGETKGEYTRRAIDAEIPVPVWHIDDGGVGFNKYKYFSNRTLVEELKNYMDTVGIVVCALDISTPSLEGILSFVRQYEGYHVHIIKRSNDTRRIAKIYRMVQLPSGQVRPRRPKSNPFDCWLPSDLYRKYKKRRGLYLKANVEELKRYQKQLADKRQKDPDLDKTIQEADQTLQEYKGENII